MSKHTVIMARHCKAISTSPGTDAKRPLSEAGVEQAVELGRTLKAEVADLDTVLVSPALRAQQTWEGIAKGAGLTAETMPEVKTVEAIYDGSPMKILEALRMESRGYNAMVVGHEPTISSLVILTVKQGEATEVEWGMPTGSAAVVQCDKDWHEWHEHCGTFSDFVHKGHR